MSDLSPITRPNGKSYRPRKIVAHCIGHEDEDVTGVVVFGTHDVTRAKPLADSAVADWCDWGYEAVSPRLIWYRDTMADGQRTYVTDPVHGRAGVVFDEIVERTS